MPVSSNGSIRKNANITEVKGGFIVSMRIVEIDYQTEEAIATTLEDAVKMVQDYFVVSVPTAPMNDPGVTSAGPNGSV